MPFKKFSDHPLPEPDQLLWKYMDFAKFVALIQKRSLYFPSLRQFTEIDPWEGALSKSYLERLITVPQSDSEIDGDKEEALFYAKSHISHSRSNYFVNCWHMNYGESDSQWKAYGKEYTSLAILSSFEGLCDSISDPSHIFGSKVTYYKNSFSVYEPDSVVTHKRDVFSHENEFRLIHSMFGVNPPTGIDVQVQLNSLIKEIVVSPLAPDWFVKTLQDFLKIHSLNFRINNSALGEKCPI